MLIQKTQFFPSSFPFVNLTFVSVSVSLFLFISSFVSFFIFHI